MNTLINNISYVIDINPNKINQYLPINNIQIKSPQYFINNASSSYLLLISNPNYT